MMKVKAVLAAAILFMAAAVVGAEDMEVPTRLVPGVDPGLEGPPPRPSVPATAAPDAPALPESARPTAPPERLPTPETFPAEPKAAPAAAEPKSAPAAAVPAAQANVPPAEAPAPPMGAPCCAGQAPVSCCRRFLEWLTYQPLERAGCCGCCHHCGYCNPPLYTYFLNDACGGGYPGCGGCSGSASGYVPADEADGGCHCGHLFARLHGLVHGGGSDAPRP